MVCTKPVACKFAIDIDLSISILNLDAAGNAMFCWDGGSSVILFYFIFKKLYTIIILIYLFNKEFFII